MNYVFLFLIAGSLIIGLINGRLNDVTQAMLSACDTSVKIAFSLIGIMAFWLGMMRIAEKSGLVKILAKVIEPIAKILFKDKGSNENVTGDIAMSVAANALGLTNAATPIGLKVMKELQENNPNKDKATDSMCMFLGMNTAGFQIIPATVIAVLVGAGAKNPTEIILPTLIVTTLAFLTAIITALILKKVWREHE
jgi:spore maturation protein A